MEWYEVNKRDLPWRNTRNPYFIWLSEIILQQTRIDQGLDYYFRITGKYPNVRALANAKEADVLRIWQGLGYYSRARNLHATAKRIVKEFNGKFPEDYPSLRSLKGVGDYTAAAIMSFAFEKSYAVVDGNVYRLLSRYLGIDAPIDTGHGKKTFQTVADELILGHSPFIYNQAIMEFGARQCKPVDPNCTVCPLNQSCIAFKKNIVHLLPVKSGKTKIRKRYFNYLVIIHKNSFYLRKRTGKDIWNGLHDFPLIETTQPVSENRLMKSAEWKNTFRNNRIEIIGVSEERKHILSHQHIHARFFQVFAESANWHFPDDWKRVTRKSVKKYAIPRLIEKYLEENIGL